jgi:hypothetical protein
VCTEICAVADLRLVEERGLLRKVPMLRPRIGRCELRKVDRLSTIRVASAPYSVPHRLVGFQVEAVTFDGRVRIYDVDGLVGDHVQLAPGDAVVLDEHYPTPRKAPSGGLRARTDAEREFLALGEPAEAFIRQGAAAGSTMLPEEIIEIVDDLIPAHGPELVAKAVARAARFGRFRAADVRSILAVGTAMFEPAAGGSNVIVGLPAAEVRSFDAYEWKTSHDHLTADGAGVGG